MRLADTLRTVAFLFTALALSELVLDGPKRETDEMGDEERGDPCPIST